MDIERGTLDEVFSDLFHSAVSKYKAEVSNGSKRYVVEVLCSFVSRPEVLPGVIYPGDLLHLASEQNGSARKEFLRLCGDVSLFVSGIFPDTLGTSKRAVNLGDYIDVGIEAYGSMGVAPFSELSFKFPEIVEVLNEISAEIQLTKLNMEKYLERRRQIDARIARR